MKGLTIDFFYSKNIVMDKITIDFSIQKNIVMDKLKKNNTDGISRTRETFTHKSTYIYS
jgi:hypothetical protein